MIHNNFVFIQIKKASAFQHSHLGIFLEIFIHLFQHLPLFLNSFCDIFNHKLCSNISLLFYLTLLFENSYRHLNEKKILATLKSEVISDCPLSSFMILGITYLSYDN